MKKYFFCILCLVLFFTAIMLNYSKINATLSDIIVVCSAILGWCAFWIFFISLGQYIVFKINGNEIAWKKLKSELCWSNVLSVILISPLSWAIGFIVYGILGGCADNCSSNNGYFLWAAISFIISSFYTLFKQRCILKSQEPTHLKWIVIISALVMNLIMYETLAMIMFSDK